MESIFKLDMDEASCTLLVVAAMFDTSDATAVETGSAVTPAQTGSTATEFTEGIHYLNALEAGHLQGGSGSEFCNTISPSNQITRKNVKDKVRANHIQRSYLNLLHRYLRSQVGSHAANILLDQYNEVLIKLKDMREILLDKSLQF
jgi:hypothetical protein